jgi:serine/threonine-protein kinase RsbW
VSLGAGRIEISIPASADWILVARLAAAAVATRLGFALEEIEDIKLAVSEACIASISVEPPPQAVGVRFDVDGGLLRVTVQDGVLSELGHTIVSSLMDTVEHRREGETAALVMSKRNGKAQ